MESASSPCLAIILTSTYSPAVILIPRGVCHARSPFVCCSCSTYREPNESGRSWVGSSVPSNLLTVCYWLLYRFRSNGQILTRHPLENSTFVPVDGIARFWARAAVLSRCFAAKVDDWILRLTLIYSAIVFKSKIGPGDSLWRCWFLRIYFFPISPIDRREKRVTVNGLVNAGQINVAY